MKPALAILAMLCCAAAHAQDNTSIKFLRVTGMTYIKEGDQILLTLRAGAPLPPAPSDSLDMAVADGRAELEAAGMDISASAGTEFSVSVSSSGAAEMSDILSTDPLQVKTKPGNIILLTQGTTVAVAPGGPVTVKSGKALFTFMSTGETKALGAGNSICELETSQESHTK
jgi:hypothetical protein